MTILDQDNGVWYGVPIRRVLECGILKGSGSQQEIEILGTVFGDTVKLITAVEAVSARDSVQAGMRQYLGPAIKAMTTDTWLERRFARVGWVDGKFLIPGRVPADVRLELNDKLPYRLTDEAELERGLALLPDLICSPGEERGAVVPAFILQAPLGRIAGWDGERYGIFMAGRTGTYKTSNAQAFMALYGPGFARDENLIALGEGSTTNAIIGLATSASDMPILLDNYKPNTGKGHDGLVSLIHRIFEGGDKARMNRNAELRGTKPIHTWPLFTGEDLPAGDPASLARVLVIPFEKAGNEGLEALSRVQAEARHLCAVGGAWIEWLESSEGHKTVKKHAARMPAIRSHFGELLRKHNPNMVNPSRVATNLATNFLAWAIALAHPGIGPIIAPFTEALQKGQFMVATTMSGHIEQGLEAIRYIHALRALLATGQAILLASDLIDAKRPNVKTREQVDEGRLQNNVIGCSDGQGGAYLFPEVARRAVARVLGDDLSGMSNSTLYAQLLEIGAIAQGKTSATFTKRLPTGKSERVLHILPRALGDDEEDV